MKIGIIVIGMMVLIASTAVVMAAQHGEHDVMIEGSKVMFFKFVNETPNKYKIELYGPTDSQVNPTEINESNLNIYEGNITRDKETGKSQLFAVMFDAWDSTDTPLVYLYANYTNQSTGSIVDFAENDTFYAEVWVLYPDGSPYYGPETGEVALIPE
jgi:hypothetical protein